MSTVYHCTNIAKLRLDLAATVYRKKYQSRLLEIIPVKRFTARGIVPRRVLNIHVFVYLSFRNSIERNGYTIFIPTPMVG